MMKGVVHGAESVERVESWLHRLGLLDAVEQQFEAHPRRLEAQILQEAGN